jgi:hypothetical protein
MTETITEEQKMPIEQAAVIVAADLRQAAVEYEQESLRLLDEHPGYGGKAAIEHLHTIRQFRAGAKRCMEIASVTDQYAAHLHRRAALREGQMEIALEYASTVKFPRCTCKSDRTCKTHLAIAVAIQGAIADAMKAPFEGVKLLEQVPSQPPAAGAEGGNTSNER